LCGGCDLFYLLGLPFGKKIPFNPKKEVTFSEVQRDVQFSDIPVPYGFILRRDQFFSYKCPTFRMGKFRYDGAWTYRKTYKFYNTQMPAAGWRKIYEEDGYGTNTTSWIKGRERLRLYIDTRGKVVKVAINLSPVR
ncbi:MAG: hypothetical protein ACYTFY_20980, partial [Planctomycetota bacterium]